MSHLDKLLALTAIDDQLSLLGHMLQTAGPSELAAQFDNIDLAVDHARKLHLPSPSPLHGERAGVRGDTALAIGDCRSAIPENPQSSIPEPESTTPSPST